MKNCIGLFGTCGKSTFRQQIFIPEYEKAGLKEGRDFYNPQLPEGTWTPDDAEIEAEHLANDKIILFPITSETYGLGSLSEVGFSLLNAIKLEEHRFFITMIDDHLDPELMKDERLAKESLRARALVKQHLKKLRLKNVYLVDNLHDMRKLSMELFNIAYRLSRFDAFTIGERK